MSTAKEYVRAEESDSDGERLRGMFRRVKEEYEKLKKAYVELKTKSDSESAANTQAITQLTSDLDLLRKELESSQSVQTSSIRKLENWSHWFEKLYQPGVSEISTRVSSLKQDWLTTAQTTQKISDLTTSIYDWRPPGAAPRIARSEISARNFRSDEISRFQPVLRNRFGSIERAWFGYLNPQKKKKKFPV